MSLMSLALCLDHRKCSEDSSCYYSFYEWWWVREGSLWGPGLVLGPVASFFVGGSSWSFCRSRNLSLSTAKPVKQLLLHLFPGKMRSGGDVSCGWPPGSRHTGGWLLAFATLALQRAWKISGNNYQRTDSTFHTLSIGKINKYIPCSFTVGKTFSSNLSAENQGHFLVKNIKYQLNLDKQNDGCASQHSDNASVQLMCVSKYLKQAL